MLIVVVADAAPGEVTVVTSDSAGCSAASRAVTCSIACCASRLSSRQLHGDGDHGFPAVTAVSPR